MAKTQACAASAFSCAAVMFKDNFDIQSVKGSAEMGGIKGEGGWNSDVGLNGQVSGAGGKISWDEKNGMGGELDTKKTADYLKKKREEDAKKDDDKKKKPHIEGQVCIVKKGDTKKDGSLFTIEGKIGSVTHRMGFPDGNWCVGYDSTPGLSGSIKGPEPRSDRRCDRRTGAAIAFVLVLGYDLHVSSSRDRVQRHLLQLRSAATFVATGSRCPASSRATRRQPRMSSRWRM